AAEIIKARASYLKPHMGLNTWSNAPKGKVVKKDVTVAKNYLDKEELTELNIIVNMYLDYAELQAQKQRGLKMADWVEKLDAFLQFNEYDVLNHFGNVHADVAKIFAEKEYEKYKV